MAKKKTSPGTKALATLTGYQRKGNDPSYAEKLRDHNEKRRNRPRDPAHQFVESPPKMLGSPDFVHVEVPYYGYEGEDGRRRGGVNPATSQQELFFYIRLKRTKGCISKLDHATQIMHLYIEKGSEAADMFVREFMRKLPPNTPHDQLPPNIKGLLHD